MQYQIKLPLLWCAIPEQTGRNRQETDCNSEMKCDVDMSAYQHIDK